MCHNTNTKIENHYSRKPVKNTFVKLRVLEKNQLRLFVEEQRLTHSVLLEFLNSVQRPLLCDNQGVFLYHS